MCCCVPSCHGKRRNLGVDTACRGASKVATSHDCVHRAAMTVDRSMAMSRVEIFLELLMRTSEHTSTGRADNCCSASDHRTRPASKPLSLLIKLRTQENQKLGWTRLVESYNFEYHGT